MSTPVAIISDIHGNLPALQAVIADIEQQGIQERVCWATSWVMAHNLLNASNCCWLRISIRSFKATITPISLPMKIHRT